MMRLRILMLFMLSIAMMSSCTTLRHVGKEQKMEEKRVKREIKDLRKEGWQSVGDLERQMKESYSLSMETTEQGDKKYVFGEGCSIAFSYDAAYFQSIEISKLSLITKTGIEIIEWIDARQPSDNQEYTTLIKAIADCEPLVKQKMGQVQKSLIMYRNVDDKMEVRTIAYYNRNEAIAIYMNVLHDYLRQQNESMME